MSMRAERLALLAVLALGCALRATCALAWPNLFFPDEIFQTLEPAHRLLFGYGVVSWEWRSGARNWLFPGFLAAVMRISTPFGPGSTGYVAGTTLALSALGVLPAWAAWRITRRTTRAGPALLAAFACAIWCELVFFAPKALNEVAAAHLLAAAVALLPAPAPSPRRRELLVAGLAFGLAVALRPHLGPAVLAGIAFASRSAPRRMAVPLLVGAGASFALAGLVDALTWGVAFYSYLRNPVENLVVGRSAWFGTEPFHAYLQSILRVWTPVLGVILALFAWGARRHPLPAVVAGVTLLVHSLFPHKEYRFVVPALALVVLVAAVASGELAEKLRQRRPAWRGRVLPIAAAAWVLASLAVAPRLSTRHLVGGDRGGSESLYWSRFEGSKRSFTTLSLRDDVCGITLLDLGWAHSGGYTYLHHDVPIFEARGSDAAAALEPHANYLVSRRVAAPRVGAYRRERCWGTVCLYQRRGGCVTQAGYDLNARLAERDQ